TACTADVLLRDIGRGQPTGGRAAAIVEDPARTRPAAFLEEHRSRRALVAEHGGDVDAFAPQKGENALPELVASKAAHPADAVAESGQSHREIRLRPGDRTIEGRGIPK